MPYNFPMKLTPAGTWAADGVYVAGTVVTRNGSAYWAKTTPTVGNDPEVNSPDQWQLIAEKGPQGEGYAQQQGDQGDQGPQGEGYAQQQGDQGDQGPQGDQGDQGTRWFQGVQAPVGNQAPQGTQNDLYLDTSTGDVYVCDGGEQWLSPVGNLQGPQGDQGDSLLPDPSGCQDGYHYLVTSNGVIVGYQFAGA